MSMDGRTDRRTDGQQRRVRNVLVAIGPLSPLGRAYARVVGHGLPFTFEGLLVAAGHYRNGILLAPVTADAIAALLAGEKPPPEIAPFDPQRFD